MDYHVLRLRANSRVLLRELDSYNSLKASSTKPDDWPALGSSFNDVSLGYFENQFWTLRSVLTPEP